MPALNRITLLLVLCGVLMGAHNARAADPDWNKIDSEALGYFRTYLRFDTSNPPDNTAPAIAFLKQLLDKEGIENQVFQSASGAANLVAHLPGPPGTKPLLLMSHADVVPAVAADWSHPPFNADLADGFVWARGTIDNKAHGIMALMTMLMLKRQGVKLRRGIEMMVNADEEAGGADGAKWMTKNHWDVIDPAFAMNEGGQGTPNWLGSRGVTFLVAVSEKRVLWTRLVVHGQSGHGSMPNPQNPNLILIDALARLLARPAPLRDTPIFDMATRTVAPRMNFPASFELSHLRWPSMMDLAADGPLSDYTIQALMHDTIAPTMLSSGFKINVVPSLASAGIDCRLLPDTDENAFIRDLRDRLGPMVQLEFVQAGGPVPSSPTMGEAWDAIREVTEQDFPDAVAAPWVTSGGTDSRFLRLKGVPAYGFVPIILPNSEAVRIHGVDERLSIENLNQGIKATYDLATRLCARPQ